MFRSVLLAVAATLFVTSCTPAAEPERTKILLVYTKPDHPWATHMYETESKLLAHCLTQTKGVDVIRAETWPTDDTVLDSVKSIVYYSRPAGDIVLSDKHREHFRKLMANGVGYAALHWATGADKDKGEEYLTVLGGWFNFAHSKLKIDTKPLVQADPASPVCRGWKPYELHDEFYLNLKFHEKVHPVLKVKVNDVEQVVAWTFERPDSKAGRSFGTTLGHFHENFGIEDFRKAVVNGILWTAHVEVPEAGAPVAVTSDLLTLPPNPKPKANK